MSVKYLAQFSVVTVVVPEIVLSLYFSH